MLQDAFKGSLSSLNDIGILRLDRQLHVSVSGNTDTM